MKTCEKCRKPFEYRVEIEGKTRNLQNRKFCLECSPWGQHNTIDLTKEVIVNEIRHKKCPKCNRILTVDKSNFYIKTNGTCFGYCKHCSNQRSIEEQRKRKQRMIDYKGGKCSCCGYNKYIGALEFHHINPKEKDFSLGELKNYSLDSLKPELDKCILVCANCHREIHGNVINL